MSRSRPTWPTPSSLAVRLRASSAHGLVPASEQAVVFADAAGDTQSARPTEGRLGFVMYHSRFGMMRGSAEVPASLTAETECMQKHDTYVEQYELANATVTFSQPATQVVAGYTVELRVDNSSAV